MSTVAFEPGVMTPEMKEKRYEILRPQPPAAEKARFPETREMVGTGWIPDPPDLRDYTIDHPEIKKVLEKTKLFKLVKAAAPLPKALTSVDLRQWCSPIEDQGSLGSCTSFAAMGIVEYFEKRAFGKFIDGSHLFIYKTTRDLKLWTGDTGAYLRNVMGSLALFGVPPETYWPYNIAKFDIEPPAFVYELADEYKALRYLRHDPRGVALPNVLAQLKAFLAAGIPFMFGFYGFPSCNSADVKGAFPFPGPTEHAIWGHGISAMGYDDNLVIKNTATGQSTTGALLIRNSWGTGWGNAGYGWLPYQYVLAGYAQDFWSLLQLSWIDTGAFELPF
jgi:C1A family cysteine protease